MGFGEVGVECQGSLELFLRSIPVPVEKELDQAERRVGFSQAVVQLNSLHRRRLHFRHTLQRSNVERPQSKMSSRQAGVRQRITGIFLARILEMCARSLGACA